MPFKLTDTWHRDSRKYLKEMQHYKETHDRYSYTLEKYGEILGWKAPSKITLPELRKLEKATSDKASTKAVQLSVLRYFLVWAGCRDAAKWKFAFRVVPKADGVFLDELEVAQIRSVAKAMGPFVELTYSLGVDNGLRLVDMQRLTMQNAEELLGTKRSTILGKGRGGGKPGHLELSKKTVAPLKAYLEERSRLAKGATFESDRLLVVLHGKRLTGLCRSTIRNHLNDLSDAAEISFDPHDLRRTYGHRLHLAEIPIETIAKLMRHENINQAFKAYIGIDSDEMREAQDKLP